MEKIKALGFRIEARTVLHIFISDYSPAKLEIKKGILNEALKGDYKRIKGTLMALAPLEYWATWYARDGDYKKIEWRECARDLLRMSAKVGQMR